MITSPTSRHIIRVLASTGTPMSALNLALATGASPSTVAVRCRALTRSGLLTRSQHGLDRRTTVYSLVDPMAALFPCITRGAPWESR